MRLQRGVDASRALQGAQHKVFVEGKDDEIDPIVIGELLRANDLAQVEVRPMGGCDNVRSAAQALIRLHPSYYFLIDRDALSSKTVEASWNDFPNIEKYNMLIWRKRELENYFIDPEYLEKSEYIICSTADLRERIRSECNCRVYLDAANLTLMDLHLELRKPFAKHFRNPSDFSSEKDGESCLVSLSCVSEKSDNIANILCKTSIQRKYKDFVEELTGGVYPLRYGSGSWIERMSGKEIFRAIAKSCFRVTDRDGKPLQGKEQHNEIAKALLSLPLAEQPEDFRKLFELLKERVMSTP